MANPAERLDRSVIDFMRNVPVHIAPILYRAEYQGRLLPESEVMVVALLSEVGPLSPTRISRRLNMQKGSLTSVLRRLEGLELTIRRDNPDDERSYVVDLSKAGEALAREVEAARLEGLRRLFESIALRDGQIAAQGLDVLSTHFRKVEEMEMTQVMDNQKTLNWYQAASPEDRKEYDSFGPWLTEVKEEAEMPPRFRAFYAENKDARFLLKVPRNADRRQLRPGMDLYEAVFAVHDGGVFVVRLEDGGVVRSFTAWDDIGAVGNYGDKLLGVWTLYLKDGTRESLEYNKVSSDLMEDVTDFARARLSAPAGEAKIEGATPEIAFTDADLFFGSAMLEIRRRGEGPFIPIHFEPQGERCFDAAGNRQVSTGVLILDSPTELIIVNRDKPSHRRGEAWYASNDIFVPYARITHFSLIQAQGGESGYFNTLMLRVDAQAIEQPCLQMPEAVVQILKARCLNAI